MGQPPTLCEELIFYVNLDSFVEEKTAEPCWMEKYVKRVWFDRLGAAFCFCLTYAGAFLMAFGNVFLNWSFACPRRFYGLFFCSLGAVWWLCWPCWIFAGTHARWGFYVNVLWPYNSLCVSFGVLFTSIRFFLHSGVKRGFLAGYCSFYPLVR